MLSQITSLAKQYNMDPKLVPVSAVAKKDLETAKISSMNKSNSTFADAVNSLVQSNGNLLFPNNIGGPKMTVLTPWSYGGEAKTEVKVPDKKIPDTTVRYGYLLGPSMYNTIERKYQWTAPQQTNTNQAGGNAKPTKKGKDKSTTPPNTKKANQAATGGTAAPGTSQGRLHKGIKKQEDKVGVAKQKLLNDENAAKLSVTTMMVPALTGIKPGDILYVPSFGSASDLFIEDWVVHSVTYTQTDGGVNLSINAGRWFGNSELMQKDPAKPWIEKARTLNADPTLTKWQQYAWELAGESMQSAQ
jgi:hypothetical protein